MQLSERKEDISISYISALCAHAGIAYEIIRRDGDGTDGILRKTLYPNGMRFDSELHIQLKSTSSQSQYTDHGEYITYKLKAKNHQDLCARSSSYKILGLLVLPKNEDEWVKWSEAELLIKGCMYWANFSSQTPTQNTDSITIKIYKKNIINSETLREILEKIAREEWP